MQVIEPSTSSRNSDLLISERKYKCLLCDRFFYDSQPRRYCTECHNRIHYRTSVDVDSSRPQTRSRLTNIYVPAYDSNRYSTVLSPGSKLKNDRRVTCPRCRITNILDNSFSSSQQYCSVCQEPLSFLYDY